MQQSAIFTFMENQTLRYLLIEHLPLLINSYENALWEIAKHQPLTVFKGDTISILGPISLQDIVEKNNYHYILINADFNPWHNQSYKTPLAFLVQMRKLHPKIRIMVNFPRATVYGFREIYTRTSPDCIVEATDCTPQTLQQAITHLLAAEVFYSKTILEIFQLFIRANLSLDALDYGILYELSLGTPIKELPDRINLATTTIYKRRIKLKLFFQVDGQSDRELIKRAKEQRFV